MPATRVRACKRRLHRVPRARGRYRTAVADTTHAAMSDTTHAAMSRTCTGANSCPACCASCSSASASASACEQRAGRCDQHAGIAATARSLATLVTMISSSSLVPRPRPRNATGPDHVPSFVQNWGTQQRWSMRRRCETGSSLASAIFVNRRRRPRGGASRPSNVDGHSSRSNVDCDSRGARRRHIDIRSTRKGDNSSDVTSTVPTNYKPSQPCRHRMAVPREPRSAWRWRWFWRASQLQRRM